MKGTLFIILTILCPLIGLPKGFILKGSVEGAKSGTVSLAYINEAGEDTTLTASISGGAFTLAGAVPEPELARLTISGDWSYNTSFFLENSAINMHLVKDAPEKTSITGSSSEIVYEKLEPGQMVFFEHARQNSDAHHQTSNIRTLQSTDSLWMAQQGQWIQTISAVISSNKENYAALYFIQWLLFKPGNYDSILSVFMQLSPAVRKSMAGKKFLADFEHLHRASPGQPAPEISGGDTSGRPVNLTAFKGKVVLLDFWSSYCGPCRQENRAMIPVYQKFHAAGFEMLSFSLDNERPLWLKAIQTDGLPWAQASDLRGGAGATANMYDITDLPRNVLIDRTGKIYARDLHGGELKETLEKLLGGGK